MNDYYICITFGCVVEKWFSETLELFFFIFYFFIYFTYGWRDKREAAFKAAADLMTTSISHAHLKLFTVPR